MLDLIWLGQPDAHDHTLVGGKAANLSRLAADYPVPPGFCLTTSAFEMAHRSGATAAQIPPPLVDQIVLSADTCWKYDLRAYGGPGYDHVLRNFLPLLRERGVSEQAIHTMLVEYPARLLTTHPGHIQNGS